MMPWGWEAAGMVGLLGLQTIGRHYFNWAVNHATTSPDRKLVCIVGDDTTGLLADAATGKGEYKNVLLPSL